MKFIIPNGPIFGVTLTIFGFWLARTVFQLRPWSLFNPLLLGPLLIITFLKLGGIPYSVYERGGSILGFFIGPATVALAVPLYRQREVVVARLGSIITSIAAGSVTGVITAVGISRLLHVSGPIARSLAAKSTTAPIAVGITQKLGGNTGLVVFGVILTGILGGVFGPEFLRLIRVKDPMATGLGIGAGSHVGGTSRAVQLGEVQGSLSSAAIALMGIVTAIIAPFVLKLLHL